MMPCPQRCAFYDHCQFYQLWQDVYTQTAEECCYAPPPHKLFFLLLIFHQAVGSKSQ